MKPSNKTTGSICGATSQIKNTKEVFLHFGITERQGVEYEVLNGREQLKICLEHLPEELEDKKSNGFKLRLYYDPEVLISVIEIEVVRMAKHENSITTKEQIESIKYNLCSEPEKSAEAILAHFKYQAEPNNVCSISTNSPEKAIYSQKYLGIKISLHMKEKSRYTFLYDPDSPFTIGVIEKLNF